MSNPPKQTIKQQIEEFKQYLASLNLEERVKRPPVNQPKLNDYLQMEFKELSQAELARFKNFRDDYDMRRLEAFFTVHLKVFC